MKTGESDPKRNDGDSSLDLPPAVIAQAEAAASNVTDENPHAVRGTARSKSVAVAPEYFAHPPRSLTKCADLATVPMQVLKGTLKC